MNDLRDLLIHELKDLYGAEKQLVKALPRMAKKATHAELVEAFTNHLEETKGHVERLERMFELLDVRPRAMKCEAMVGLVKEAQSLMSEDAEPEILDAGLIASAQRVEHYEMAAYGCARAFAEILGESEVSSLLQETLDEESQANELLTSIAEQTVNVDAMNAGSHEKTAATSSRRR